MLHSRWCWNTATPYHIFSFKTVLLGHICLNRVCSKGGAERSAGCTCPQLSPGLLGDCAVFVWTICWSTGRKLKSWEAARNCNEAFAFWRRLRDINKTNNSKEVRVCRHSHRGKQCVSKTLSVTLTLCLIKRKASKTMKWLHVIRAWN